MRLFAAVHLFCCRFSQSAECITSTKWYLYLSLIAVIQMSVLAILSPVANACADMYGTSGGKRSASFILWLHEQRFCKHVYCFCCLYLFLLPSFFAGLPLFSGNFSVFGSRPFSCLNILPLNLQNILRRTIRLSKVYRKIDLQCAKICLRNIISYDHYLRQSYDFLPVSHT